MAKQTTFEPLTLNNKKTAQQVSLLLPWIICGLGAVFYSYEYFLRIMPSVLSIPLRQYFNYIDAATFGGISAFYYYIYTPMQLPVGLLMDRYGPRRLLTMACFICAVGTYVFIMRQWLVTAAIGRFLMGFGSAFAYVGVLKLASIWFSEKHFAFFAGFAAALGAGGAMIGEMNVVNFFEVIGWMNMFYIAAIIGLILTVILWVVIRDDVSPTAPKSHGTENSFKDVLTDLSTILKTPQIWINGLIGCLIYLPTTVFAEQWGPSFLEHARGFTPAQAVTGVAALFLGFIVGAPLSGALSDLLQRRRVLMFSGAVGATLFSSLVLFVPGLSIGTIYFFLFITGLFYSVQALVFAISRDLSPINAAGTAVAITNMLVMLGGMILQPIVGVILEMVWGGTIVSNLHHYTSHEYQVALSVVPIGIALAGILTVFLKDTVGRHGK